MLMLWVSSDTEYVEMSANVVEIVRMKEAVRISHREDDPLNVHPILL